MFYKSIPKTAVKTSKITTDQPQNSLARLFTKVIKNAILNLVSTFYQVLARPTLTHISHNIRILSWDTITENGVGNSPVLQVLADVYFPRAGVLKFWSYWFRLYFYTRFSKIDRKFNNRVLLIFQIDKWRDTVYINSIWAWLPRKQAMG